MIMKLNNINEMAYPDSFKMNEFKNIKTYAGRIRYCEERLTKIGAGSARIAYKIDNQKVLKIAKNNLGIEQNLVESEPFKQKYEVCARVFDYMDSGEWLEMELATKANISDFKRILGISFEQLGEYIRYSKRGEEKYFKLLSKEQAEKLHDMDIYNSLFSLIADHDMPVGDLLRKSSWGIVKRNGRDALVIIDFGYSEDVRNLYTKKLQNHFRGI